MHLSEVRGYNKQSYGLRPVYNYAIVSQTLQLFTSDKLYFRLIYGGLEISLQTLKYYHSIEYEMPCLLFSTLAIFAVLGSLTTYKT